MDRGDGGIRAGTLIKVADKQDAQKGHKLNNTDIRVSEVNIASGGPRFPLVGVYRSPVSTPVEDGKLFLSGWKFCRKAFHTGRLYPP